MARLERGESLRTSLLSSRLPKLPNTTGAALRLRWLDTAAPPLQGEGQDDEGQRWAALQGDRRKLLVPRGQNQGDG